MQDPKWLHCTTSQLVENLNTPNLAQIEGINFAHDQSGGPTIQKDVMMSPNEKALRDGSTNQAKSGRRLGRKIERATNILIKEVIDYVTKA